VGETGQSDNRQIARAAGTVMFGFVLSTLAGLVRQVLVTQAFGTSPQMDAFNAASTYPDLIFNLIAGGALASAFVPTFTGLLEKKEHRAGWLLASAILNLIVLILTIVSALSAVFAAQIVQHILAPDFSPQQQELTATLLRILLLAPVIFGASGLVMGILNSHQVFFCPALAPSMYGLGLIFGVLFFVPFLGIYGLAWGGVMGAALHFGVQLPALLRLSERQYSATLGLHLKSVRNVARLMGPRLLGVAVVQINFVVNTILASGQPEGSLTAIKVAWAVMAMPQVVIAQAIAIAALPTFSAQVARGRLDEMRASLAATLRGVLLLSLPASLGLILLRRPIIAALFQRGAFDAHSTDLVAWALLWYAAGLVGHSVVEIVSRAFYALHDTKTPVFIGTIAMSLNVVFSLGFSALFVKIGWAPHGGLALANSLATALEMAGLGFIMSRRLSGLNDRAILTGLTGAGMAVLGMGIVLWIWENVASTWGVWANALGGIALGGTVYGAILMLLRVPEVYTILNYGLRRIRRS
jgi:putative peptidoglycan lipid II flippase